MNQEFTRNQIHSGLSGLRNDSKWSDMLNFRSRQNRTFVVPRKFKFFPSCCEFHTLISAPNGQNFAIGSKGSWGFAGTDSPHFYPLWRLGQRFLGDKSNRDEESTRLIVFGSYTGDTPLKLKVVFLGNRLILDVNVPEPVEPEEPETPDNCFGCCSAGIQVNGFVYNIDTLAPVEGATVEFRLLGVLMWTGLTNASGFYFASDLEPGTYTITITADGYDPYEVTDTINGSKNRNEPLTTEVASVACSTLVTSGEEGYYEFLVELGTATGICTLTYDAITIPDKFNVVWNGSEISTGYRGAPDYDSDLFAAVGEHIVGGPTGTISFNKTSPTPTKALVKVYAPLPGTAWNCNLSCPV